MAYKTGNPALNNKSFDNLGYSPTGEIMTLDGTATKSILMMLLAIIAGYIGWATIAAAQMGAAYMLIGGILIAFIVSLIIIFVKKTSPILAPIYALIEGFVLGAISYTYEVQFGGIVLQAILLTAGIFLAMLLIYKFRLIKVTENFKLGVAAATGGIAIYYLLFLGFGLFGMELPLVASNSVYGIGFTILIIIIAAFNLVVDFDFIESGVNKQAPKYMEWYASFGLFITIIWLYLEILRLLGKARSR